MRVLAIGALLESAPVWNLQTEVGTRGSRVRLLGIGRASRSSLPSERTAKHISFCYSPIHGRGFCIVPAKYHPLHGSGSAFTAFGSRPILP